MHCALSKNVCQCRCISFLNQQQDLMEAAYSCHLANKQLQLWLSLFILLCVGCCELGNADHVRRMDFPMLGLSRQRCSISKWRAFGSDCYICFLFVSVFVFCAVLWWCRLGNRQVIQLLTADSASMTVACCKQTLTGFSMSKYSSAGCGTDELASPFTLIAC